MSSVFLLWIKWLFWLRRWKEVLHVYIHDLQLNTVPNAIILYNSLALILGIILHDVIQKMIKSKNAICEIKYKIYHKREKKVSLTRSV